MKTAKFSLAIIVLVCVLISVCTLVINGPQDVMINTGNHIVNVTICRYDKRFAGTPLQIAFSYFLVSAFVLVLCLTIIFYALVAKSLHRFEVQTSRASVSTPTSIESDSRNKEQGCNEDVSERRHRQFEQQFYRARMSFMSSGGNAERISTQMYRVFAIITVIFIVSYLPHLVVLILTKSLRLDSKVVTSSQQIFMDLAYNCPYISTVSNPVVYGFRSAEFREQCKKIFRCQRSRRYFGH